ncbi:unnamed protein product [Strongylus vulgaris]|uniref:Uncharacterized protein n=1 Tax=Strongylus vulgaris TaxID=40348 RepID=A0A3P7JEQ0_STRVU|nr:unnamed protein product [Strongylus vulgaris]
MMNHRKGKFLPALLNQVVRQPFDTLKVCIPAMVYILQNNLFYVAASHLDAATFMITSQLKIFTAAIFTVIMLKRSLTRTQWFALAILFIGVSLVQLQTSKTDGSGMEGQRPFVGFMAVVIACCLSGFAGIYFEKILKGSAPVSLWMRNIQMCVFAIPASFGGFAGIYFEKILKGSAPVSLWMRNIQMCVFAIPASFGGVMWQVRYQSFPFFY